MLSLLVVLVLVHLVVVAAVDGTLCSCCRLYGLCLYDLMHTVFVIGAADAILSAFHLYDLEIPVVSCLVCACKSSEEGIRWVRTDIL